MARKNYFETLQLNYLKPDDVDDVLDLAILKWEKCKGNPMDPEEKKRIKLEKEEMLHCMRDSELRRKEAENLKETRIKELQDVIDILKMGQSEELIVTKAQKNSIRESFGLPDSIINSIYNKNGIVEQNFESKISKNDYFMLETNFNKITKMISELNRLNDRRYPWSYCVKDLYDFTCFCTGGTKEECEKFYFKRTDEIRERLHVFSIDISVDRTSQLLNDIATIGETQIFKDENTRKKYDLTLKKEKLRTFLDMLQKAPSIYKHNSLFAETCINKIKTELKDYDLSVFVYNEATNIQQNPYIPLEALVHVMCGTCGTDNVFRLKKDAQNSKCNTCGANLYIECPNCKKLVPVSSNRCSCGFLLTELRFFEEYVRETEFALKEMDIYEAKKKLAKAEGANPKSEKLSSLKKRVTEMSDLYGQYIKTLDDLITLQKYFEASRYIAKIALEAPKLRIDSQKKVVKAKIDKALRNMPDKNDPFAADKCIDIIREVKDYQPAIEMLRTLKPKPPVGIHASVTGNVSLKCTVNWSSAKEKGVTYTVVRKINEPSKYHTDGQVVAKDINVLEVTDSNIESGVRYFYTVFSCRAGIYSEGISKEVSYYSEIDESTVRVTAESGICRMNWVLPKNAAGVRILRREGAMPSDMPDANTAIIAEHVAANYTDTNVKNGIKYFYRLLCMYPVGSGFQCSRNGVTFSLTPEEPPVVLKSVTSSVVNSTVTIQWTKYTERKFEINVREVSNHIEKNIIGAIMPSSDLNKMLGKGRNFSCTTSDIGQCSFDIPLKSSYQVAVITSSGSSSVISSVMDISSIEKCEIDRTQSRIEMGRLILILKDLPENLSKIHYMMAVKSGKEAPWASRDDAMNQTMKIITAVDYQIDGMIVIEPIPQDDLYISVIGEYNVPGGQVIYSEPSKIKLSNKPKTSIKYSLSWIKAGLFSNKMKACKWIVETSAEEVPELMLVYKTDGHIPMRLDDPKVAILQKIVEREEAFPGNRYEVELGEDMIHKLPENAEIRMMMLPEDMAEYEIICNDVKTLKVPS